MLISLACTGWWWIIDTSEEQNWYTLQSIKLKVKAEFTETLLLGVPPSCHFKLTWILLCLTICASVCGAWESCYAPHSPMHIQYIFLKVTINFEYQSHVPSTSVNFPSTLPNCKTFKQQDSELCNRADIKQATGTCQISRRYGDLNYQSHGFETSLYLTIRRHIGYWNGAQVIKDTIRRCCWKCNPRDVNKGAYVSADEFCANYRKVSNIRRTVVGNKTVDHSDEVGASPVGAAPTTSSFST